MNSNNVMNSMSLINLNSIKDFEKKINEKVEFQRFRGNIYVSKTNSRYFLKDVNDVFRKFPAHWKINVPSRLLDNVSKSDAPF